jgi:hypothetical protein
MLISINEQKHFTKVAVEEIKHQTVRLHKFPHRLETGRLRPSGEAARKML